MPDPQENMEDVSDEIKTLRELIAEAAKTQRVDLRQTLDALETVANAMPKLITVLKARHEMLRLEDQDADPLSALRQALSELEKEWPELHALKEQLRSGGSDATGKGLAA